MFSCYFQPIKGTDEDRFKCNLIYFSFFQPLELGSEADNPMQSQEEIKMLYVLGPWDPEISSSKKPILHVG